MGFLDRFKKRDEEITPESRKGKVIHSIYDDSGMLKERKVFKDREHTPARVRVALNKKISPETRAKISKGLKTAGKYYREMQSNAPRIENDIWQGFETRRPRRSGSDDFDGGLLGGLESEGIDLATRGRKKATVRPKKNTGDLSMFMNGDDWDWMR